MRIRTVKPEWLEDEKIALASVEARLLSVALLLLADDYGNGRAHPAIIGPRVFPGAQNPRETLAKAVEELARLSFVVLYEVEGQSYFHVRNWDKHQKVDKPGKPQCPPPPAELLLDSQHSREPRESVARVPESLAPDHDHDHDLDQDQDLEGTRTATASAREPEQRLRPTDPGPSVAKVPCPGAAEVLTPEQRATLETSGIPGWAIEAITADFAARYAADQADRRTIVAWRKCAARAVAGDWNNPNRRPKKPEPGGGPPIALKGGAVQRTGESFVAKYRAEQAAKSGDAA